MGISMYGALIDIDLGDTLRVSAIASIVIIVLVGTWLTERRLGKGK